MDGDDGAGSTDDRDMAAIGEHWCRVRSRCSTVGWFCVRRARNVRTRSVGGAVSFFLATWSCGAEEGVGKMNRARLTGGAERDGAHWSAEGAGRFSHACGAAAARRARCTRRLGCRAGACAGRTWGQLAGCATVGQEGGGTKCAGWEGRPTWVLPFSIYFLYFIYSLLFNFPSSKHISQIKKCTSSSSSNKNSYAPA